MSDIEVEELNEEQVEEQVEKAPKNQKTLKEKLLTFLNLQISQRWSDKINEHERLETVTQLQESTELDEFINEYSVHSKEFKAEVKEFKKSQKPAKQSKKSSPKTKEQIDIIALANSDTPIDFTNPTELSKLTVPNLDEIIKLFDPSLVSKKSNKQAKIDIIVQHYQQSSSKAEPEPELQEETYTEETPIVETPAPTKKKATKTK